MSQQDDAPALLQLPAHVLRGVWDLLPDGANGDACPQKQALRRSCKALRDATTPWARRLLVELCQSRKDVPRGPRMRRKRVKVVTGTALEHALAALAAYPAAATLCKLSWALHTSSTADGVAWPKPGVLRTFLQQGQARLAALAHLDISFGPVSTLGSRNNAS